MDKKTTGDTKGRYIKHLNGRRFVSSQQFKLDDFNCSQGVYKNPNYSQEGHQLPTQQPRRSLTTSRRALQE
jgi:hypothetical protein